jgi:hypothetical protein
MTQDEVDLPMLFRYWREFNIAALVMVFIGGVGLFAYGGISWPLFVLFVVMLALGAFNILVVSKRLRRGP